MIPSRDCLLPYVQDRQQGAEHFGVCERTIIRWLQKYNLYHPTKKFGEGKLDIAKAEEIRKLHKEGRAMKDLAAEYDVTISTISRILHHITHKQNKDFAEVSVIYHPS